MEGLSRIGEGFWNPPENPATHCLVFIQKALRRLGDKEFSLLKHGFSLSFQISKVRFENFCLLDVVKGWYCPVIWGSYINAIIGKDPS